MNKHHHTLAIATVPWQEWRNIMNASCALQRGTIFEELDMPFYGIQAACDANYSRVKRPQRQEYGYNNNEMKKNISMGRGCGCR